ncbi:MAG: universal stress protein [Euryarchaeota archaeon]|nr:universal stress protein [Euryarchaeota archaeon]
MQEIKRIVIPVDSSDASRIATEQGVYLAKLMNIDVSIVSVNDAEQFMVSAPLSEKLKKERQDFLQEAKKIADLRGVSASTELMTGAPVDEIVKHVKNNDLIVMGSQGKTGFNKLMLGSVSEKVLQRAPCSVMIIKPNISLGVLDVENTIDTMSQQKEKKRGKFP